MKIWVDDLRIPPAEEEWIWVKTSRDAIAILACCSAEPLTLVSFMSLDHDLGGDDTTRPVILWMIEHEFWPAEIFVHSANPPGAHWLNSMIERYHPDNAGRYRR